MKLFWALVLASSVQFFSLVPFASCADFSPFYRQFEYQFSRVSDFFSVDKMRSMGTDDFLKMSSFFAQVSSHYSSLEYPNQYYAELFQRLMDQISINLNDTYMQRMAQLQSSATSEVDTRTEMEMDEQRSTTPISIVFEPPNTLTEMENDVNNQVFIPLPPLAVPVQYTVRNISGIKRSFTEI